MAAHRAPAAQMNPFDLHIDLAAGQDQPDAMPQISDIRNLDVHLPEICERIFKDLGSRQLEGTYQKCLKNCLEEAGVAVKPEEVIQLMYRGREVGTRRIDLLLKTLGDNQPSIIELKAVSMGLTSEHLLQLEYYMHHFDIDIGYLINFPHDTGFPEVDDVGHVFYLENLSMGDAADVSDRCLRRTKHKNSCVQLIKVVRASAECPPPIRRTPKQSKASEGAKGNIINVENPQTTRWGLTKKGLPCKWCLKQQSFCKFHEGQEFGRKEDPALPAARAG